MRMLKTFFREMMTQSNTAFNFGILFIVFRGRKTLNNLIAFSRCPVDVFLQVKIQLIILQYEKFNRCVVMKRFFLFFSLNNHRDHLTCNRNFPLKDEGSTQKSQNVWFFRKGFKYKAIVPFVSSMDKLAKQNCLVSSLNVGDKLVL